MPSQALKRGQRAKIKQQNVSLFMLSGLKHSCRIKYKHHLKVISDKLGTRFSISVSWEHQKLLCCLSEI